MPPRDAAFGDAPPRTAGVPLSQLMENAGAALAQEAERRCRPLAGKRAALLCGKGNNGGRRLCLRRAAWPSRGPTVHGGPGPGSSPPPAWRPPPLPALPQQVAVLPRGGPSGGPAAMDQADVLIDCVFGFSFRGELSGTARPAAGVRGRPALPEDLRRPAQRRGVRHRPGQRRGLPGGRDRDLHREKARQRKSYPAKEFCGETVVRQVGVPGRPGGREPRPAFSRRTSRLSPWPCSGLPDPQSQQGGHGQAAAGVRQLGHGRGLRHGGPGGPALRRGPAADRRGGAALSPRRPGGAPGRLPGAGLGKPPGAERATCCSDALGRCTACVVGCGLGDRAELVCPPGLLPLPAAPGGRRRRPQFPQPAPRVPWRPWRSPWCSPPTPGRWPACVQRHHPGDPVGPAGGRPAEGPGHRRGGGAQGGRHRHRRPRTAAAP